MADFLKLDRPMIVFDIESTGIVPSRDRIVELAVLKILPTGESRSTVRRLNPEMPIPAASTAIHGITDADVADCPRFTDIAEKLFNYLDGCDLAGYNLTTFDVPMLEAEFKRAGYNFSVEDRKILDAYNIFCKLFPRNLTAAYKFFCGKDLEGAHGAAADTAATWEVLQGELEKYPELPRDVAGLAAYCEQKDPDMIDRTRRFRFVGDEAIINFGKNAGRSLKEISKVDPGFLRWILRSDFPDEVRKIASDALMGKYPVRKKDEAGENN